MLIPKTQPVRSQNLRRSAQGVPCTVRLPGICSGDPATSVLAHSPVANGGMATKGDDSAGAICCDACHSVIDGRIRARISRDEILECWIRGHQETVAYWRECGLVTWKGAA